MDFINSFLLMYRTEIMDELHYIRDTTPSYINHPVTD